MPYVGARASERQRHDDRSGNCLILLNFLATILITECAFGYLENRPRISFNLVCEYKGLDKNFGRNLEKSKKISESIDFTLPPCCTGADICVIVLKL